MAGSSLRDSLRESLLESYRFRASEGTACGRCGVIGRPLAFHVIEFSGAGAVDPPSGCVPMSSRRYGGVEGWRGAFPLCATCAPPCSKCGLPVPTEAALEFLHSLQGRSVGGRASLGLGVCREHIHMSSMLAALMNRLLGRGRFSRTRALSTSALRWEAQAAPPVDQRGAAEAVPIGQAESMHHVPTQGATSEFAMCWKASGLHLQREADRRGLSLVWLKSNLEPPFMEHLSFRLGNQLFFIRVEADEDTVSVPGSKEGVKAIAKGCDGHACLLRMRRTTSGWEAAQPGWGLLDCESGQAVDPSLSVTDERVEMTDWEVHDFAVQVVRQSLEKEGRRIMSSQGNPAVDPSLWFVGEHGPEWVVVRAVRYPRRPPELPADWPNIAASCSSLSSFGNFAPVAIASASQASTQEPGVVIPLWRGGPMVVSFAGLVPKRGS